MGGAGRDSLFGGAGNDTVDYSSSSAGVTVSLGWPISSSGFPTTYGGDAEGDSLVGIENITGSKFADYLYGDGGDNILDGNGGYDWLQGNGGNDIYKYHGDQTVINGAGGELDMVGNRFTEQNLWFTKSGNDILIEVMGTNEYVDLWNGATPGNTSLSAVVLSDGSKLDSGFNQLVSAMAQYSATHLFNPTASGAVIPTDTTLQAAITAAWHH